MPVEPWVWSDAEGGARLRQDLDAQGWSCFHAPGLLALAEQPVELSRRLFGWQPLRLHRQEIRPDPDNPRDGRYWRSILEARLHTDGPRFGLPPSALFMFCQKPAADGGDVLLLDTWALLREIEADDPALFQRLLRVPRHTRFAEASHWGPTLSLRRGHLICLHPSFDEPSDETGERFRAWVERAEPVRFRPREGDVYVVNNHRCLHGRLAFADLSRAFLRVMFWFVEPFAAPADLVERAAAAGRELSLRLAGQPIWIQRRFGADVPPPSPRAIERLRRALDLLAHPEETVFAKPDELQEIAELQDIVLSACLPALDEELPSGEERRARLRRVLDELERALAEAGEAPR